MTAPVGIGIHLEMPHARYHADPCERPSLSASMAKVLLGQSPRHAWHAHPRLGAGVVEDPNEAMTRGSIIHALLLGHGADLEVVDAADWRKQVNQEIRENALAAGRIPVLAVKLAEYTAAARALIGVSRLGFLVEQGMVSREVVAVWESEGGVLCRRRLDAWNGDVEIHDLKTVTNARAAASGAGVIRYGYDVDAVASIEALETLHPELAERLTFHFHFCEVKPPYGAIEAELSGAMLELGRRKWRRAVDVWGRCLKEEEKLRKKGKPAEDAWPSYTETVISIDPPGWALTQDLEEQLQQMETAESAA